MLGARVLNTNRDKSPGIFVAFILIAIILIVTGFTELNFGKYEDGYKKDTCEIINGNISHINITINTSICNNFNFTQIYKFLNTTEDMSQNKEITCYYLCKNITSSLTISEPERVDRKAWIIVVIVSFVILGFCGILFIIYFIPIASKESYEEIDGDV